jgi:tight adherence protein C
MNTAVFAVLGFMVVAVIGMFFYGLFVLINPTRTAQDRLRELQSGKPEQEAYDIITVDGAESDGGLGSRLGNLAAPQTEEDKNNQRKMLLQAGFKSRHALQMFNGLRVSAALALPVILGTPYAVSGASLTRVAMAVLGLAAVGYYGPYVYVKNRTDGRKRQLLKSFPDALDLLVSCVEAGLGLDAAFRRVAIELETAAPDLSREFQLVTHEISAGVPRTEALRHLEHRTGLDEIRSLVNMLTQAERFGTSIAKGLRVHSRMTRQKRMSRAEEEAAKVSPKLTIVMVLFLLPVLGTVLIGPAAIRVSQVLANR